MIKKIFVFLSFMFFVSFVVNAEEVELEFEKIIGAEYKDYFKDVIQIEDGGFVAIYELDDYNSDVISSNGNVDGVIERYDKDGNLVWQKSWGGSGNDKFNGINQTLDGGFVVTGTSDSIDIEGMVTNGDDDAIIVKFDKNGNLLWQKNWGGSSFDFGFTSIVTSDNAVIMYATFNSRDIEGFSDYSSDIVLLKYDVDGNLVWQKGLDDVMFNNSLLRIDDNSFIITGFSRSFNNGEMNDFAMIYKFDNDGNMLWQKSWGSNGTNYINSVAVTLDGGFIVVGQTSSFGVDGIENKGKWDALIVKYDKDGNILWQKSFGGNNYDFFESIYVVDDGFVATGMFDSTDIVGLPNVEGFDAFIVKYDKEGNLLWQSSYGEQYEQRFNSPLIDRSGNLIVCVESYFEDEGEYYRGHEDVVLIKYDKEGNLLWQKKWDFGGADKAKRILLNDDNNLFVFGDTISVNGYEDVFILKYSFKYNIKNTSAKNGIFIVEQQTAKGIITPTPNEGYELDKIIIKDKNDEVLDLELTKLEDGTYSFDLYTDVSVEVLFKEKALIENPKTGSSNIVSVLFTMLLVFVSGLFVIRNYNKNYEI